MAAKAMKKSGAALEKLRADIKSGSPENVYIFYGEETYLRDRYLEELKALLVPEGFEEFNYHRLSGKGLTVQDLTEVVEAMPMMAQHTMVVVTDLDIFRLDEQQRTALMALLADFPEYCTLVLVYDLLPYKRDGKMKKLCAAIGDHAQEVEFCQQERDQLEGEALLRLSFLCFNDISAMSAYHRQIRALIPADRNPWTQGSPSVLMLYHSKSGSLDRENDEMRECMPIYSRVASGHGSGAAVIMQAETEFMRGNLTDADILCRQAEEQALEAGEYSIYTAAAVLSARLALYDQPLRGGFPSLDRAADTLRRAHQYRLLTTVELGRGWLSALLGQTEQLPAWLTAEGASMAQVFPLIEPVFQVIVGRVLLAQSQWAQAAARTPRLLRASADARFVLCGIYAHLQNAMALMHLGKEAAARQALCEAWSLAQPDGILLPFAESDPCLDRLLDELAEGEVRERLHTLAVRFRAGREAIRREGGLLAQYGLTERELEIAGLAAQRKSSREIAEILSISVKSVNNRLNAVYEKLGLGGEGRNKRQALAKLMKIS